MSKVAIVIPSYEPDERLICLVNDLVDGGLGPIYIVNDGSGVEYDNIFGSIADVVEAGGGKILEHEVNRGKGRALKTAFEYILNNDKDAEFVVTADSDGQHTCECIQSVIDASLKNKDCLVLGVRTFDREDVPWKSRVGNHLTEKVFEYITGVHVTDTQTGLRALPGGYLPDLLNVKGERFEYEMRMLIDAVDKMDVIEVPIKTIYDSKENHQTHFNPFKDSIRIYRILCERFVKYIFSSISACLLDLLIFGITCSLLREKQPSLYITYATVIARVVSAVYNYLINYRIVFKSNENSGKAAVKYFLLAVVQMSCSALLVTGLSRIWPDRMEVLLKAIVDTALFFVSYAIQQRFVFKKQKD